MRRAAPAIVAAALAAAVVLALGANAAYRAGLRREPGRRPRTDFHAYLAGADALAAGRSPFGVADAQGLRYVYPPAIALVVSPLRPLGGIGAAVAWYAVSVATFAAGAVALRRALGPGPGRAWLEVGAPLALVFLPAASALQRGQFGPVLTGLVAAGCAALARSRDTAGGAALGAAAALKVTPGLAVLALAAGRRPRALAGAALALAGLLLAGPAAFLGPQGALEANADFARGMGLRYLCDPGSEGFVPGARDYAAQALPNNQSLVAIAFRVGLRGGALGAATAAVAALAVLAALAPFVRRDPPRRPVRVAAAIGLAAAASLLAAPVAWHHHFTILYPALAAVVAEAARDPHPRRGTWAALACFGALEATYFALPAARAIGLLGLAAPIPLALALRVAVLPEDDRHVDGAARVP